MSDTPRATGLREGNTAADILDAEVKQARRTAEFWKANHLRGNAEIERLAAERDALRAALESIMEDRPSDHHNGNRNDLIAWQMWRRAREALNNSIRHQKTAV